VRIDILTLFDDAMDRMLSQSILGRAREAGLVEINCHQIRGYTINRQMQVDDYPYGGGMGMVMQADPLFRCLEHVKSLADGRARTVCLSPQGAVFDQAHARRLFEGYDRLILVCGHYEGIDERFIEECVDEEISIGDFVLTGGEIPALAVCDAVCRMVPGVLKDQSCFTEESHWSGLLEYPQYSRPETWRGRRVPPVLQSGDHSKVARWRRKQSILRTYARRPDLFYKAEYDGRDLQIIFEIMEEMQRGQA